jgi:amino acid adenylation domain-containing protein
MSEALHSVGMSIAVEPTAATRGFVAFPREDVERSVPERFERQVLLYPNKTAVADSESSLTYGELNRLANRIAHAILAMRGAEPEPVALLGSGVPVVAAMLGVLKAGKFYVTLDTSQPTARSVSILAECRPALLITDGTHREQSQALCAALDSPPLSLLDLSALDPELSDENLGLPISADSLAYILYTSGSTGKPKGVMQDHRYVLHLTMVYTNGGRISTTDRLVLLYAPSFAGAVRDIYCTVLNGATLLHFDVKRTGLAGLADWLRQERITVFFAVATMFRHFCRLLPAEDRFPLVRLVFLGSETVYAGEIRLYQRHFSEESRVIVSFGTSELSPICQFPIWPDSRIEGSTVPSGYPVDDVELLLWDADGQRVAAHAVGEVVVRSRYLSRGYWGHPELTEAAFMADPEGGDRRMFRTGDQGRMLPDGCLLHLGRGDFQVKIRGYRVETAEVEAFFTASGLVRDALVTAWLDSAGEQNLAAWLVPMHRDAPPSVGELRALVAAGLPDYMMPAAFILMDSLPLTANGKLDRRALPDPRLAGQGTDTVYVAPRTPVELRLKGIWSELLGLEKIGTQENFFDLGGHSLLAMQAVARIAAAFHVIVPFNCLFECPTIARLAELVERARSVEADEAIRPLPRGADAPLSLVQQSLWIAAEMEGPSDTFNMVRAFRLEGTLDSRALERALAAIVARHDNLRASFRISGRMPGRISDEISNDGAVQTIAPEQANVLSFVDLRRVPENRRKSALDASLRAAHSQRFDLARGPLWSAQVIRLTGNQNVLHLAMHHIISDDWSVQVLLRELSTIYKECLTGAPDPLPKLPVQYADYAAWQRRWLSGERLAKQLDYWQTHLQGAPPLLNLPLDRPPHAGEACHASMVQFHLDRDLTLQLRRLSRESETTLFVTVLAAYAILLSQYGNPEDIVIGAALANRYPVETEPLIGFFVNTLALRVQWRKESTFREIQACAHRAAVNGFAHPDVPFDRIVETLRPNRSALHTPIFQTLFVLQNVPKQDLVLPGLVTTPIDLERPSAGATFDLSLSLQDSGGDLHGALEFNTALFDTATIERMATHFKTLLARIVQNPDSAGFSVESSSLSVPAFESESENENDRQSPPLLGDWKASA